MRIAAGKNGGVKEGEREGDLASRTMMCRLGENGAEPRVFLPCLGGRLGRASMTAWR